MTHRPQAHLSALLAAEAHRQGGLLRQAALFAAIAAGASVLLLGLSGWFIAGAALAGVAGVGAVQAFNYLLPSAAVRLLAILRTGARYGERLQGHAAALNAMAGLRSALFRALASAAPQRALALSSGEASARLVEDVGAVEASFIQRSAPWAVAASLATAVLLTALASPASAAALALALAVQTAVGLAAVRRWTEPASVLAQAEAGRLKEASAAWLAAGPELACYELQDRAVQAVLESGDALNEAQLRLAKGEAALVAVQAAVTCLGVALVLLCAGQATIPMAALAALSAAAALEGAGALLRLLQRSEGAREAEDRLESVLSTPTKRTSRARTLRLGGATLRLGERVAIVGPSGSGKTRLIETMIGLRGDGGAEPDQFAYAPQDCRLLAGSVRDNLAVGSPAADEAQLWRVLECAALADRVRELPDGLDAWIGEDGARLSGGERRRLSLARALLRPAPWLVLDEPTESLDPGTAARVLRNLERRLEQTGQGLLLVTHSAECLQLARRVIDLGLTTPEPDRLAA